MSRLRDFYEAEIVDAMTKKFSYKNKMAVPKLEKIVINMGVGEAKDNAKVLFNEASKKLDQSVNRGILHKNNAARKKSQLALKLAKLA